MCSSLLAPLDPLCNTFIALSIHTTRIRLVLLSHIYYQLISIFLFTVTRSLLRSCCNLLECLLLILYKNIKYFSPSY